jgi:uncharacterized OB-fold protein
MHMPGKLRKDARCWKCGRLVVAVMRHCSTRNDRATLEFFHLKSRDKTCVVRTTFDKSERAMKGLPRK